MKDRGQTYLRKIAEAWSFTSVESVRRLSTRIDLSAEAEEDSARQCPLLANRHAPIRRLQQLRHVTHKTLRLRNWREARSHDASPINQELREVPFYAVAQQPALLLPKPNVERVGVLAVDLDLGEQWESYAIGSVAEGGNLRV